MHNRTHYKRLTGAEDVLLVKDLYPDKTIEGKTVIKHLIPLSHQRLY